VGTTLLQAKNFSVRYGANTLRLHAQALRMSPMPKGQWTFPGQPREWLSSKRSPSIRAQLSVSVVSSSPEFGMMSGRFQSSSQNECEIRQDGLIQAETGFSQKMAEIYTFSYTVSR
jgi:hypothetical protein